MDQFTGVTMRDEYKFCLRCGRKLKNPEAKKLGYGKICYSKIQSKSRKKPLFNIRRII